MNIFCLSFLSPIYMERTTNALSDWCFEAALGAVYTCDFVVYDSVNFEFVFAEKV
jgi:hypothetical protein